MRKRIVSLALALMMCFSLSVTAFATFSEKNYYFEGKELSYDEITNAPEYLIDFNFENGEIVGGKVTYTQPKISKIITDPLTRSDSIVGIQFSTSLFNVDTVTMIGVECMSNYFTIFCEEGFNAYHTSSGTSLSNLSSYRYDIALYDENDTSERYTLADRVHRTFWNLEPDVYRIDFILRDSLPMNYNADGWFEFSNAIHTV